MTRETAEKLMEDIYEIEENIRGYADDRSDYSDIAYELSKVRERLDQAVSDFESEMETYEPRVKAALKEYSIPDIIGAIHQLQEEYVIENDTETELFEIADPEERYVYKKIGSDYLEDSDWYNNDEENPLLKLNYSDIMEARR